MKKIWLMILMVSLVACSANQPKEKAPKTIAVNQKQEELTSLIQFADKYDGSLPVVNIKTSLGTISVVLFPQYAPKAVENFTTHAKEGYYNGLTFHRVIKDFMIQGGDPKGDGTGGESIWGGYFKNETTNQLYHFRGALAMANSGKDTNGSQFYIVQAASTDQDLSKYPKLVREQYEKVGGAPWLDGDYTIFGQVIAGMDVVDAIAASDKTQTMDELTVQTYQEWSNQ